MKTYNESIRVCVEARDKGTKELLDAILTDEEEHVDWLEAQQIRSSRWAARTTWPSSSTKRAHLAGARPRCGPLSA